MIRFLFSTAAVTLAIVGLQAGVLVAASPTLSASRASGPMGTTVALSGSGFTAGDTVFIDITRTGAPEGTPIGKVTPDASGAFAATFTVGIGYAGPEFPVDAPVGGGESMNFPLGSYVIMAYPDSFGPRTRATLAQAPKVSFQITSGLPATGGPAASGRDSDVVPLALALTLLLLSGFAFSAAARKE